ncbi:MAG: Arginine-tRNA ligase [Parcubacteria group bacterium GW2011_GWA2_42_11]|nr:MAG: Arginine-tRNA ligase [Parcubacteria group bacterium GW2011_GWA2_42_11]
MNIRQEIKKILGAGEAEIGYCADSRFGDYATNWALKQAKKSGQDPLELAQDLAQKIKTGDIFVKIEAVKPGFINFTLAPEYLHGQIAEILTMGEKYGELDLGQGQKISIDFVSANPTGPVHVGNARGGPMGDVLGNVLKYAGYQVSKEYYVNDAGHQVEVLGHSILGDEEAQYNGEYIENLRQRIKTKDVRSAGEAGVEIILAEIIKPSMVKFGIKFDNWLSEKDLLASGQVDEAMKLLKERGVIYEQDGAWWFKASEFGDEADRVIVKSGGDKTYFGSDIAGHKKRLDGGADKLIDIWGADHHGAVRRLKGALTALGYENKLEIILTQFVRVLKGGEEMKMSKRAGTYISIDDLIDEVGKDATRFFFLTRSPDTHMDFDLDLAKEQSEKNPVYYVQYAHARICAILRKAENKDYSLSEAKRVEGSQKLTHPAELALIKQLIRLPETIEDIAHDYQVHRLPQYALDLVRQFHKFYEECRVLETPSDSEGRGEVDKSTSQARLALCKATKIVLANTLSLMGISAPEKM